MSENEVILIGPMFDEATVFSFGWSKEVKEAHEAQGYKVHELSGRPVTRVEHDNLLIDNPDIPYIFYDHGSEDCLWGSKTEKVIDLSNVHLLVNRDVYTLACLSALKLGVEAMKIGAKSFWGYTESFAFSTEALDEFKEFANSGTKYRLEDKALPECLKLAKELATKLSEKLIEAGKYIAAILMNGNRDALVCYNGEAPPEEENWLLRFFRWLIEWIRNLIVNGYHPTIQKEIE